MYKRQVLGGLAVVVQGLAALLSFVAGAATSASLINFGRRTHLASEFALPLMVEGYCCWPSACWERTWRTCAGSTCRAL